MAIFVAPHDPSLHILGMVQINHARLAELCKKHDVRVLKLFGSAARGEDRPDSDIDLIVEFEGTKSLFDLIGLELELQEFLGREVDLLTERSISPYLRDRILSSASVIYERTG
jgi:predicted nucleotidyltransferase